MKQEDTQKVARKPIKVKVPFLHQIGWSSKAISMGINSILMIQTTFYCTNILGMAPALVGGILLATKIFDGSTDFLQGLLINKVRTRLGQVRHYEFCLIPLWICTVLLFSCPPGLSSFGKAAWIFVFTVLAGDVFGGMMVAADPIYLLRSNPNRDIRAKMLSINGVIVILFTAVASTFLPMLMNTMGRTDGGWTKIAIIFAVPLTIIGFGRFIFVKEIADVDAGEGGETERVKVGEGLKAVFRNKYIFIIAGATLMCHLVSDWGGAVGPYYFEYIVGNLSLLGSLGILGLAGPVTMLLFPILMRKIGAANIVRWAFAIGIVGFICRFFAGTSIPILLITTLIGNIAVMPLLFMGIIYVIDCINYGEWKSGIRANGFIAVVNQLAMKLGKGLAPASLGLVMSMAGYDGTAELISGSALTAIKLMYSIIPAAALGVAFLIFTMHDLDKKLPQIKKELEERRAGSASANIQMEDC
jgi:GPH family glycoside/pentoside/hexuronide:cation symporter